MENNWWRNIVTKHQSFSLGFRQHDFKKKGKMGTQKGSDRAKTLTNPWFLPRNVMVMLVQLDTISLKNSTIGHSENMESWPKYKDGFLVGRILEFEK